jgi:hypothetical protein
MLCLYAYYQQPLYQYVNGVQLTAPASRGRCLHPLPKTGGCRANTLGHRAVALFLRFVGSGREKKVRLLLDDARGAPSPGPASRRRTTVEKGRKLMDLQDLNIGRIVLHEVHKRTDERQRVAPTYGVDVEQLRGLALDAFRDRVIAAMGRSDRCVQMEILSSSPMIPILQAVLDAPSDAEFVDESRNVADALADAQTRRDLPGGVVVVFTGTVGAPSSRFFAVIKAETHNGFMRDADDHGHLGLVFLEKLLLTPQTKLYKIGMFIDANRRGDDEARWNAYLYDDGVSPRDRYGAAQYFYESFLGLAFMQSSARETKVFHDLTKGFITALQIPEEEKVTLHNALVTYLKADVSPTVSVRAFADSYVRDRAVHDSYTAHMYDQGFPRHAVNKDLGDIRSALRQRRILFRSKVSITAPAEAFEQYVEIEAIQGASPDGRPERWTRVTIKDQIASQE